MKKIIYVCSIVLITLFSCDDFLEIEPQDSLTSTGFYITAKDAVLAVNAAYDGFQTLNYYGLNYPMMLNLSGGDAVKGGFGAGDRAQYLEYINFNVTDGNIRTQEFYQSAWGSINRANQVLDNVGIMETGPEFSEALKSRILGEATFLRALHYYNLVLGFGGMPIYTTVPKIEDDPFPRASIDDTWAFIIQDLQDAAASLPDAYESADLGRATKGAANAMLARISAFRGNWSDVVTYTNAVISSPAGYDLAPDYGSNFDGSGNNNIESIFEVQYTISSTSLGVWGQAGDWNSSALSRYSAPQLENGGWAFMSPSQDLVDDYEAGDLRLAATVYQTGDPYNGGTFDPTAGTHAANAGNFGLKKFTGVGDDTNGLGFAINLKLVRFGEILLLKAEAENELNGPTATALDPLNRIRVRAALPEVNAVNNPGLDQSVLRDILLHERRIELSYEGVRFYDVIHRGRAAEFFGARGFEPGDELFPIPPAELEETGWEQN